MIRVGLKTLVPAVLPNLSCCQSVPQWAQYGLGSDFLGKLFGCFVIFVFDFFFLTALLQKNVIGLKAALNLPHRFSFQWEITGQQEVTLCLRNFHTLCKMVLSCLISKPQDCKLSPGAAWRNHQWSSNKNLLTVAVPGPTGTTVGATWSVAPLQRRNKLLS